MRKFSLSVFALLVSCLLVSQNGYSQDEQKEQQARQVIITKEATDQIPIHIMVIHKGGANWEKSAKTLEQKYGAAALPALTTAFEFSKLVQNSDQFRERCQASIDRINRNLKEGLSGGRSKE